MKDIYFRRTGLIFGMRFLLFLSIGLFSTVCSAVEQVFKLPVQSEERLELVASQGSFHISPWDESFIQFKTKNGQPVRYEKESNHIRIYLEPWQQFVLTDLGEELAEIKVPRQSHVSFKSTRATFHFDGLHTPLSGSTEFGDVYVKDFQSVLSVHSVNGNVRVQEASGEFDIETINGDIHIHDSEGVAYIRTVSGDQKIQSDLRTVNSISVNGLSQFRLMTLDKFNLKNVHT